MHVKWLRCSGCAEYPTDADILTVWRTDGGPLGFEGSGGKKQELDNSVLNKYGGCAILFPAEIHSAMS